MVVAMIMIWRLGCDDEEEDNDDDVHLTSLSRMRRWGVATMYNSPLFFSNL